MKFREIITLANTVYEYVEKYHVLPSSANGMSKASYSDVLCKSVLNPNSEQSKLSFDYAPKPNGDSINITLSKSEYQGIASDTRKFISTKKRLPNYVTFKNKKIIIDLCVYCFAKIIKFYAANSRLPKTCEFNTDVFKKSTSSVSKGGAVCKAISNASGVTITDYKTLYTAFTHFKYEYYYNDMKAREKTLKDKAGNCADLGQLAYYALKELDYSVEIVRGEIKCNSGNFGHIWCRLKLSSGTINFDASAAAKQKAIGTMICGKVKDITNVNPSWLLSDDGKT